MADDRGLSARVALPALKTGQNHNPRRKSVAGRLPLLHISGSPCIGNGTRFQDHPSIRKCCAVWKRKRAQRDSLLAQARKQVAELQAWKVQIVKAWIAERITKAQYDNQMQQVGTQLEAAGPIEGEAVLELGELELLLDLAEWMLANAAGVWARASWERTEDTAGVFPHWS